MWYLRTLLLASLIGAVAGCFRSHERSAGLAPDDAGVDGSAAHDAFAPDLRAADAYVADDAGPGCEPVAEVCDALDQDCDGLVDEGALCSFAHASGACADGTCTLQVCDFGFADCDGDVANGCETDVTSDRRSCGACGEQCRVSEACVDGGCEREEIVDLAYADHDETGCVVLGSGRLVCWGKNEQSAIASGTTADQLVPVEVDGVSDVRRCALSMSALCVLTWDDRVLCRGATEIGLLWGRWTEIAGIRDVVQLRAGAHHFCVLDGSSTVSCWGRTGALGIGVDTPSASHVAVEPDGLPPSRIVAANARNGCTVDHGGVTRCWGRLFIRAGRPPASIVEREPIVVEAEHGAVELSHTDTHGCFVGVDRALRCWGEDVWGAFGIGRTYLERPTALTEIGAVREVWVNGTLTVALTEDRRVRWWGRMPNAASFQRSHVIAQDVHEFDGASRVVAGLMTLCAQLGSGSVWCMGWNGHGGLGDGTREPRPTPVPLLDFE